MKPRSTYDTTRPLTDSQDDRFVQSLARGLSVIESFRSGRDRLTMAQIAQACGLTRAGARRILLTLDHLGYVRLDGRLFQLTPRILELGAGYARKPLWETAQPILEDVATALRTSVSAGLLELPDVVYKLHARPERDTLEKVPHLALAPGARLPAFATALGRVLLAALPEEDLERYLASTDFPKLTKRTITEPDAIRRLLDQFRQQDWAYARGEVYERYACIAVPLRDRTGRVIAGVNMGMPIGRAEDAYLADEVAPRLRAAADAITAAL